MIAIWTVRSLGALTNTPTRRMRPASEVALGVRPEVHSERGHAEVGEAFGVVGPGHPADLQRGGGGTEECIGHAPACAVDFRVAK